MAATVVRCIHTFIGKLESGKPCILEKPQGTNSLYGSLLIPLSLCALQRKALKQTAKDFKTRVEKKLSTLIGFGKPCYLLLVVATCMAWLDLLTV